MTNDLTTFSVPGLVNESLFSGPLRPPKTGPVSLSSLSGGSVGSFKICIVYVCGQVGHGTRLVVFKSPCSDMKEKLECAVRKSQCFISVIASNVSSND